MKHASIKKHWRRCVFALQRFLLPDVCRVAPKRCILLFFQRNPHLFSLLLSASSKKFFLSSDYLFVAYGCFSYKHPISERGLTHTLGGITHV